MSTTENTNAIDEKKNTDTGSRPPDVKGFLTNVGVSIVATISISIFIIGGFVLYTTKIAQSMAIPDNSSDKMVNINIISESLNPFAENKLSQKAIFNYKKYLTSLHDNIFNEFSKSANLNTGYTTPLYLYILYEHLIKFNSESMIYFSNKISSFSEPIIMLIGLPLWILVFIINFIACICLYYFNLKELFKTSEDYDKINFISRSFVRITQLFQLLVFLFLPIPFGFILFMLLLIVVFQGLIAPLYTTYTIKVSDEQKNIKGGIGQFLMDTFFYKRRFFLILLTISLLVNGLNYLGTNSLIYILIAVGVAYLGGLYAPVIPNSSDGFSSLIKTNSNIYNDVEIEEPMKGGKGKKSNSILNPKKKYNIRLV